MIIYIPNHVSKALHVAALLFLKHHNTTLPLKLLLRGSPDLTVNNNVFLTTEVLKFIHKLCNNLLLLCLAPLVNKGNSIIIWS